MFRRLRNLWKLSGIEVDGWEYETQRKKIINKITDVYRPSRKEAHASLDKYNKKNNARLARILEDDPKEMFEEHNENV